MITITTTIITITDYKTTFLLTITVITSYDSNYNATIYKRADLQ